MFEFYKWASENFGNFMAVTIVLVVAVLFIIEAWKEKS